jgi:HAD superfamily hydrolase (TIGR01549 family)
VTAPSRPSFVEARSKIRAVFFDLDGTLIDTDDAILDTWASKLERFSRLLPGVNVRSAGRRALLVAEGPVNYVLTLLDLLGLDDNVLALGDRLRRARGLRTYGEFVAVEGVVEMLHGLAEDYRLGIITTRSRRDAQAFVRQFGLQQVIHVIVSREDTWRLKPHPQPVQHAAGRFGLSPAECVLVGDTAVDILSAKAAGSYAVGVLCGFGEREDLVRAGADLILGGTAELKEWLPVGPND